MAIEVGIGVSAHADVFTAGVDATLQALSVLPNRRADVILVFCSIRFADPRLIRAIRQTSGKVPLVGCTDAGGITTAGSCRRGVTVMAMAGRNVQFIPVLGRRLSGDPLAAGKRLAENVRQAQPSDPKALFLFPDGLSTNASAVLEGVKNVLGTAIPIVGGAAADDFFFQKTFQFFEDELLTDSVPGLLIGGEVHVGIGVRHGWLPLGRPRLVTKSAGNHLYELDGQPAAALYEDYLGVTREDLIQEPLAQAAMTYPLGSPVNGNGDYLLRDAIRVGQSGSLICTGELTQGNTVQLMIGGYESALEAAQQAATQSLDQLAHRKLKAAMVFSSAARQKMLGSEFQGEIDVIRDALGGSGIRMGGFYTYGELAPMGSPDRGSAGHKNIFHNESVVVVTLSDAEGSNES